MLLNTDSQSMTYHTQQQQVEAPLPLPVKDLLLHRNVLTPWSGRSHHPQHTAVQTLLSTCGRQKGKGLRTPTDKHVLHTCTAPRACYSPVAAAGGWHIRIT